LDEKPPVKRSLLRRAGIKLARIAVVAYIGLALVLAAFQTQLIFPGASSQGHRDAVIDAPRLNAELVTLTTPTGDRVAALFGRALDNRGVVRADADGRPTLLYFYGNGMCMADCEGEFVRFRRRGFNVMVAEFVGYGMSGGRPSEQGVYATADACFDHLLTRGDIDKSKLVPVGWSLGAAAAFHIASTRPRERVPCVVTISAFTSMDAMARKLFPYLPTGMVLRHHFRNDLAVTKLKGRPLFLAHGTHDRIIPFAMSEQLATTARAGGSQVTKYDVAGGDHNDVFDVGGTELLDAVTSFRQRQRAVGSAMRNFLCAAAGMFRTAEPTKRERALAQIIGEISSFRRLRAIVAQWGVPLSSAATNRGLVRRPT
jgi:fermentation-respiration switch protein FrsA (DUF1100 family)